MKKVRIGNDIRLVVDIDGLNDFTQYNIKQVKAYILNVSTNEPTPTQVDVCRCNCGPRGYHFYPYRIPYYHFYGIAPIPHCYSCCGWGHPHCVNRSCCHCSSFIPDDLTERFLAPSRIADQSNHVEVYFPAKDQLKCGMYKLVLVVLTFEHGWGKQDVHTYTIDYGAVFELVNDGGDTGYVSIEVSKDSVDPSEGGSGEEGGTVPGGVSYATTYNAGIVRLANNIEDCTNIDDEVITVKTLRDNVTTAYVDDENNALVITQGYTQRGNTDDEAD